MYPKLKIMAFNFYGFSFNLCQCKLYSININMVLVWECIWKWLQYELKSENAKNIETEKERMEKRWNEWNSSPLNVHLCKISSGKSLSKHCTQVLHIHLYALSMANGFWRSYSSLFSGNMKRQWTRHFSKIHWFLRCSLLFLPMFIYLPFTSHFNIKSNSFVIVHWFVEWYRIAVS